MCSPLLSGLVVLGVNLVSPPDCMHNNDNASPCSTVVVSSSKQKYVCAKPPKLLQRRFFAHILIIESKSNPVGSSPNSSSNG